MTKEKEEIHWHLVITGSMCHENEFCLSGTNDEGNYVTIWFDSYDFLQSVNTERIKEI